MNHNLINKKVLVMALIVVLFTGVLNYAYGIENADTVEDTETSQVGTTNYANLFNSDTYDFGDVEVGDTQTITIPVNAGSWYAVHVNSIEGLDNTPFNIITTLPRSAYTEQITYLNIEFAPDSIGDFNTVMEVSINSTFEGTSQNWWTGVSSYYYSYSQGVFDINLSGRGVEPAPNSNPIINFITVIEINANDSDGDTISISLGDDAPDFVSLNGNRIQFNSNVQPGTYTFTVKAEDGMGGIASKKLTVTSFGNNNNPVISSIEDQTVVAEGKKEINIEVADPEGDNVILGLADDTPDFARLEGVKLLLEPGSTDLGNYTITILASDGKGGLGIQKVKLEVVSGNN